MIEVEKKFQPTEGQLEALIKDSVFVGNVVNHDIGYDYSDCRLIKKGTRLRNRNGVFELKIGKSDQVSEEIEDKKDIEKYFGVSNLEEFVKNNLIIILQINTKRKKYKKGDFNIDIDEMDFGYNVVEIELMVSREEEVEGAQEKIINLAKEYNFDIKKLPSKRKEYFRLKRPDIYKKLYGEDDTRDE